MCFKVFFFLRRGFQWKWKSFLSPIEIIYSSSEGTFVCNMLVSFPTLQSSFLHPSEWRWGGSSSSWRCMWRMQWWVRRIERNRWWWGCYEWYDSLQRKVIWMSRRRTHMRDVKGFIHTVLVWKVVESLQELAQWPDRWRYSATAWGAMTRPAIRDWVQIEDTEDSLSWSNHVLEPLTYCRQRGVRDTLPRESKDSSTMRDIRRNRISLFPRFKGKKRSSLL